MKRQTILVTGAAGFIGSHLTERLLKNGAKVIGIDSMSDYYTPKLKRENLKNLLKSRYFIFYEKSILDLDLTKILNGIDYVFHEAAQAGVRASWGRDFSIYVRDNILATQRILEAGKGKRIKKFIFASSSSIYGEAKSLPMKEEDLPRPISPYGVTKLAAENLCFLYWKNFGIPALSLRYFTVYGPRQRPDMAFHKFIQSGLSDKKLTIYGNGEQTRDFTYIDDIINASMLALKKGKPGEIYNIGGGNRITLNDVLPILEKLLKKKLRIKYIEKQRGDVRDTFADTSKAQKELGYRPKVDLEEGLKEEILWLQKGRQFN